jgi:hypothetical protein
VKNSIKTLAIISVFYVIAWFIMPVQMSKNLIWGIILVPIIFIINIHEEKKADKQNKEKFINENIQLTIKEFINKTMLTQEDIIVKLINSPIMWCGIIYEINKNSVLLNNENIEGFFISSKLFISDRKICDKVNITFVTNNRNIATNLNKGDKIFTKNRNIYYHIENDKTLSFFILLNENILYKYSNNLYLKYDNDKGDFENISDILEFSNIILKSNNFRIYDRLSYFVKIYIDDKFIIKINSDSTETVLCEKGFHSLKAEIEIDGKSIKSTSLNVNIVADEINILIELINENGNNELIIKEK